MPSPPRAMPGLVVYPPIARAMQRLHLTAREVDERLSVEDCLDEADFAMYLHDVDHEPEQAPSTSRRR